MDCPKGSQVFSSRVWFSHRLQTKRSHLVAVTLGYIDCGWNRMLVIIITNGRWSPDLPESIVRAIEPGQATSRDEANLIEMPLFHWWQNRRTGE